MNMKYFKIKHIALLLAVTSAPLYTACDFMDCSETDYYLLLSAKTQKGINIPPEAL